MKILIAYAGKTGTTQKCAMELKEKLPEAVVVDLKNDACSVDDYDFIIIGSGIRMGAIHKSVKKFISKNYEKLRKKKLAFFVCNGFMDKTENVLKDNIPFELLQNSICATSFGGEMEIDRLKGFDRLIVKIVLKATKGSERVAPTIFYENIEKLAIMILEELVKK
ncbi:MAG TPA: flavodoxin domain-containing protein [Clostridia bacterium]|nr:flavodoxin domain-containing protein [Clostridia bacterium]